MSWVFSGHFGFLPQGKLTARDRYYGPTVIGSRCCGDPALVAKLNIKKRITSTKPSVTSCSASVDIIDQPNLVFSATGSQLGEEVFLVIITHFNSSKCKYFDRTSLYWGLSNDNSSFSILAMFTSGSKSPDNDCIFTSYTYMVLVVTPVKIAICRRPVDFNLGWIKLIKMAVEEAYERLAPLSSKSRNL